ncbi:MAG TPA: TonB-dependent receptor [Blastocatellia bacterium]|nr:TonB-dependent receptor [Blastocatellia bacterium]
MNARPPAFFKCLQVTFNFTWLGVVYLTRLLTTLILFSLPSICFSQGTTATLTGAVTDPLGAAPPGAIVTVSSDALGVKRRTTTNGEGYYTVAQLPPSVYSVKVEAPGFAAAEIANLILQVGQRSTLNVSLTVKGGNETVIIEGGGQALTNTQNAEIGEVIENKRIIDLPLNGRQFTQLIALTPGIGAPAGGTMRGELIGGFDNANFTINGARETDNYYTVDGVGAFDRLFNTLTTMPSVDAIQEFRVRSSLYDVESGFQAGGHIAVALKSGTREWRGSIYEYFRNDALDARNFFDGPKKAPNRQNQYGATAGFPIYRDKLFGFGSFEGLRLRRGDTRLVTVPTTGARQGNLFDYLDANGNGLLDPSEQPAYPAGLPALSAAELTAWQTQGILPTRVFNPTSIAILNLLAQPNRPGIRNNLQASPLRRIDQDQFTTRLDWRPTAADSVFTRFLFANVDSFLPFGAGGFAAGRSNSGIGRIAPGFGSKPSLDSRNLAVGWTRIFNPQLVGAFLFGLNMLEGGQVHQNQGAVGQGIGAQFQGVTTDPRYAGVPEIRIDSGSLIDPFGDVRNQLFRVNKDFQYGYNLSYTRGGHTLRGGAQWVNLRFRPDLNQGSRGGFNFVGVSTVGLGTVATRSGLANFLLGVPEESFRGALASQRYSGNEYAFYLQDDWKVTRRLTINLGLRYELVGQLRESNLRASVFDFRADPAQFPNGRLIIASRDGRAADPSFFFKGNATGVTFLPIFGATPVTVPVITSEQAGLPEGLIKTDTNNFAPRLGFAFDVFGDARTVVRGGFGVYYSRPFYDTRMRLGFIPPFFNITDAFNSAATTNFTTSLVAPIRPFTGGELPFTILPDYNMGLGQVNQAALGAQRLLTNNLAFEAEYVGSRGHKLLSDLLVNYRQPAAAGGTAAQRNAVKTFPALGGFVVQSDNGDSWYHAGVLKLTQRLSRGATFFASYTFSKSLDTDSFGSAGTNASATGQNPFDKRSDLKGRSDHDLRHRFVFSGVGELPFGKGRRFLNREGFLNAIAGGWSMTAILTMQSNSPMTPILSVANLDTGKSSGQRPQLIGDPNSGPRRPEQWFNNTALYVPNPAVAAERTYGSIGRNTLEGPSYKSMDLSLLRYFPITERLRAQFRVEFFNAFNFVNFNLPGNSIAPDLLTPQRTPDPARNAFGTINSARPAREIQFALRLEY